MTIVIQIHGLAWRKSKSWRLCGMGIGMSACCCNDASRKSKSHVWFWNGEDEGGGSQRLTESASPLSTQDANPGEGCFLSTFLSVQLAALVKSRNGYLQLSLGCKLASHDLIWSPMPAGLSPSHVSQTMNRPLSMWYRILSASVSWKRESYAKLFDLIIFR